MGILNVKVHDDALLCFHRNKSLLLILASYAVSVGPALAWVSVLNYSLLPLGIHQVLKMGILISA